MWRRYGLYIASAGTIALGLFLLYFVLLAYLSPALGIREARAFSLPRGMSFAETITRLREESALRHPHVFRLLALLRGDRRKIKAGQYTLTPQMSSAALLRLLVAGQADYVVLTVPEGFRLEQIAERVARLGISDGEALLQLAHSPTFIAALDLPFAAPPPNLEGLLYPETYHLPHQIAAAALIRTMLQPFRRRALTWLEQAPQAVGLSPYEALTLASIVEKETGAAEERTLIAGVFLNRLRRKMRLASDPTVIYGVENFDGNLTRKHLRTRTPYNTYTNRGLPPTPIASVGEASIRAVIEPQETPYLFFVAKGDGTHHFSTNYQEHDRAVWRYQKRRRRPQR